MDLRREAKPSRRWFGMLSLLLFLAVLFLCTAGFLRIRATEERLTFPAVAQLDARAVDCPLPFWKKWQSPNPPGMFTYAIAERIDFANDRTSGRLLLKNPMENSFPLRLELRRNDTGELLLSTDYLLPNQKIQEVILDAPLPAGEYAVTAHILVENFITYEPLGELTAPITVAVAE